MSIMDTMSESAASIGKTLRQPVFMATTAVATFLGGHAVAQAPTRILARDAIQRTDVKAPAAPASAPTNPAASSNDFQTYEELSYGSRMPGNYFFGGFEQTSANHSLFNGQKIVLGGVATLNKKRTLDLVGMYGYQLHNPGTYNFGYHYTYNDPFYPGTHTNTAGAYSFSPSQTTIRFRYKTPPKSPIEASVGAGINGYLVGGNVIANFANPQLAAEVGVNIGSRDDALNLYIGAKAEYTRINQSFFNLSRYYDQDQQNVLSFGVQAALRFNPAKHTR